MSDHRIFSILNTQTYISPDVLKFQSHNQLFLFYNNKVTNQQTKAKWNFFLAFIVQTFLKSPLV